MSGSPKSLVHAVLEFIDAIHRETGEEPDRIVLPSRAFEKLRKLCEDDCTEKYDRPISGVAKDGRLWLACTEIVEDRK